MSNSNTLRETQAGQSNIFNEEARKQEKSLSEIIPNVILKLKELFPESNFILQKTIRKTEIASIMESITGREYVLDNKRTSIKPDGGVVYIVVDGEKHIVLVSEAKKQGTNDLREEEGLDKQAMGNAVERCYKNIGEISGLQLDEDIMPYIVFGSGCDFANGSPILERMRGTGKAFNKVYLHKEKTLQDRVITEASFFLRHEFWSTGEMSDYCFEMAKGATEYYIDKYGK